MNCTMSCRACTNGIRYGNISFVMGHRPMAMGQDYGGVCVQTHIKKKYLWYFGAYYWRGEEQLDNLLLCHRCCRRCCRRTDCVVAAPTTSEICLSNLVTINSFFFICSSSPLPPRPGGFSSPTLSLICENSIIIPLCV